MIRNFIILFAEAFVSSTASIAALTCTYYFFEFFANSSCNKETKKEETLDIDVVVINNVEDNVNYCKLFDL